MQRILVLEDEPDLQELYRLTLGEDYAVAVVASLGEFRALEAREVDPPDLLIADLSLPDGSFLSLMAEPGLRQRLKHWAILFVTAFDDIEAVGMLLSGERRDYVSKPFNTNELIVKVRRLLAGAKPTSWRICSRSLTVTRDQSVSEPLTALESRILSMLGASKTPVSRLRLMDEIWCEARTSKKLDQHLGNLRRKLAPLGIGISSTRDGIAVVGGDSDGPLTPTPPGAS